MTLKTFRIIRRLLVPVLLAALAPGLTSCGGDDAPAGADPVLSLNAGTVGAARGSQFVSVKASGSWTISSDAAWVSFIPASGTGSNNAVALSYQENKSEDERTARITLTADGKAAYATLTQRGTAAEPGLPGWLELPEVSDGLHFFSHTMTNGQQTKRNYAFAYSPSDYISLWVAYPLNSSLRGTGSRPAVDPWTTDPLLKAAGVRQPAMTEKTYVSGYNRGHQLPSADRYWGDSNAQTFYVTNMTPQLGSFNSGIWADLEGAVRSWSVSSGTDTLYVVTGAVAKGSTSKATCGDVQMTVPVAYWKALLMHRTTSGFGRGGYAACGFYLPHTTTGKDYKTFAMSIDDLEAKLGIDLFVNLPDKVGTEVAAGIEAEDPTKTKYWF